MKALKQLKYPLVKQLVSYLSQLNMLNCYANIGHCFLKGDGALIGLINRCIDSQLLLIELSHFCLDRLRTWSEDPNVTDF